MTGHSVSIAASDGSGSFRAYLAAPSSGNGPGIVLVQGIFGLDPFVRAMADRYAAQGYVVLAPDLYWRQEPGVALRNTLQDWQRAFDLHQRFDENRGVQDIQAAIDTLRRRKAFAGRVGVLGFGLGGKLAFLAACRTDAAVSVGYYGLGIENALDEIEHRQGRLVLHLAGNDAYCPPEARDRILAATAGLSGIETYLYPGVDHGFADSGGDHFDRPGALLAHDRSISAFRRAMGPHFDLSTLWALSPPRPRSAG